jgi:FkbM family methyltransferase
LSNQLSHFISSEFRYGNISFPSKDTTVGKSLSEYGEWAQKEIDLLSYLIKKEQTIIDVGAYIGTHTLAFSSMVGKGGKVFSFEPNSEIYSLLIKNIESNNIDNIRLANLAISDAEGQLFSEYVDLSKEGNFGAFSLKEKKYKANKKYISIKAITLDSLKLNDCRLIKIDAEGMELKVLSGAIALIKKTNPFVYFESNNAEESWQVIQLLRSYGYKIYAYSFLAFNESNYKKNKKNIFPFAREIGLLGVPKILENEFNNIKTKKLESFQILNISTLEDLFLCLLKKPQYKKEMLSQASGAAIWGLDFWDNEEEKNEILDNLSRKDQEIGHLNENLSRKDQEIGHLNENLSRKDQEINQILLSRSWRVTSPLRKISSGIKYLSNEKLNNKKELVISIKNALKKHIAEVCNDPQLVRYKINSFLIRYRSGGIRSVLLKLRDKDNRESPVQPISSVEDISQFMRAFVEFKIKSNHLKVSTIDKVVKVAVIVPVFRGIEETKKCIDSILGTLDLNLNELVIVNDYSPDKKIHKLLDEYKKNHPKISLIKNVENLGFVKSVNKAIKLFPNHDVILLNSDTEVSNNWLQKIVNQAYSSDKIGTVTPLSNNATICNYPNPNGWTIYPANETPSFIDKCAAESNLGQSIDIPTAVGFCMYIKRRCIDEVGLFDEKLFDKGYGEENDFCIRATSKNWHHILALDTFVHHTGEVSFSVSSKYKKNQNSKILKKKYPFYDKLIHDHVLKNEIYLYNVSLTASRYKNSLLPVILFVTHSLGGGTEKHVRELSSFIVRNNKAKILILRPSHHPKLVNLKSASEEDNLNLDLAVNELDLLYDALNLFGIKKIHIHHIIGFQFSIEALCLKLGVQYDFTFHDYYSICPRVNMVKPGVGFCNKPLIDECNICLKMPPDNIPATEIVWWRAQFNSFLSGANNLISPSMDAARRINYFFPNLDIKHVTHEKFKNLKFLTPKKPVNESMSKHFLILGILSQNKGRELLSNLLDKIAKKKLPIKFTLIGYPDFPIKTSKNFSYTGPYDDKDILLLIKKQNADAILFLSQCPETYSYTLSYAMLSSMHIIAPKLGSFPERLNSYKKSSLFNHELSLNDLVNFLIKIKI